MSATYNIVWEKGNKTRLQVNLRNKNIELSYSEKFFRAIID